MNVLNARLLKEKVPIQDGDGVRIAGQHLILVNIAVVFELPIDSATSVAQREMPKNIGNALAALLCEATLRSPLSESASVV